MDKTIYINAVFIGGIHVVSISVGKRHGGVNRGLSIGGHFYHVQWYESAQNPFIELLHIGRVQNAVAVQVKGALFLLCHPR